MRALIVALILLLAACNTDRGKPASSGHGEARPESIATDTTGDVCWTGTMNNKIPVFLHYQVTDKVIVGAISYLNTKDRTPIKIIGTIEDDSSYRLLEFATDGNITGIITGKPSNLAFGGSWFSPKTRKELPLSLTRKDTFVKAQELAVTGTGIFGRYHYQYSDDGYQGDLELTRLPDNKVAFSIFSVTGAPGRNIAELGDTILNSGTGFIYKVPESDSCEIKVSFYKGFAAVSYTNGYCIGQFGFNATVDGIFLKVE